jgi:hypothetical protein
MKTAIAVLLYLCRFKYSVSELIDEDTITAGYGPLNDLGQFKYSVPRWVIMRHFHTTSWDEYMHIHFGRPRTKKQK